MGREIHVKAEAGAEFIGIDQILDLVADIPPPATDDETAKAFHKIQKDLTRFDCKDNLMNLIKNNQLVPLSPITFLPVDFSGMDNFLSWSYVASNIVPIKEFIRLCESWHIKVIIEFVHDEQQAEAMGNGSGSQVDIESKQRSERELTKWMRETWIKEGKPGGSGFFDALKKYVNQQKGPIVEHYTTSKKGPGIRWNTGTAISTMTKKAIQNKVSAFKKELQ